MLHVDLFTGILPADELWDVVSATRRSSGVAPRACVRVYARVLVPLNLYSFTYIHAYAYGIEDPGLPSGLFAQKHAMLNAACRSLYRYTRIWRSRYRE